MTTKTKTTTEDKKKYIVTSDFRDGQDNGKMYSKDDTFPKPANKKIEDDRIQFLVSNGYIKEV